MPNDDPDGFDVYHELRHISRAGGTIGHDVEDWDNMISALGTRWNCEGVEVPDLLAEGVDWRNIQANRLFDEPESEEDDEDESAEDRVAAGEDANMAVTLSAAGQTVVTDVAALKKAAEELRGRTVRTQ